MPAILPPVRRPVPLGSRRPREPLEALFTPYGALVCGSGTQALALAIGDARKRSRSTRPEVILPAYGCPDLVTACVYAGVAPRLVDTAAGEWGYDLAALRAAVGTQTVAIVAVNLLGAGDQAAPLREIVDKCDAVLIQDSAQHLPEGGWVGDYVVLSFGRGKPLNLLGGGALLYPPARAAELRGRMQAPPAGLGARLKQSRLAGLAFNIATQPNIYALVSKLLGGSVGGTHYKVLESIAGASDAAIAQVTAGLADYRVHAGYDASVWDAACREWSAHGIELLRCSSQLAAPRARLRLPLLARDERQCAAIVAALQGLGASRMYGKSLEQIDGLPAQVAAQGPFANASALASRLFTLPTHSSVTPAVVRRARDLIP